MKKTVFKPFYNYEKEEKWLNQMSLNGLQLVGYYWAVYVFEEGKPDEYEYRIEFMRHFGKHPENLEYIEFLKELKVECVGTYMYWSILRKKKEDGPFEIFSGMEDKMKQYKKIRNWWFSLAALEYFIALYEMILGIYLKNSNESVTWFPFFCGFLLIVVATCLFSVGIPLHKKIKCLEKNKELFDN
ncbi:DUF2812 domain-containing protein [Anaerosacchariphilus polymeriproducens]|uniref:DUF2812 domain-containing protein n=1 Tax=Anaerosacchariphilus polymeriproducens TaxID=1812858 RepID=A0A371ASE1_9FIRM|nr:DUF2812 domain-containing protein [Anaerosacchariphilus polymeriproducens]RDU22475.1 DUF2812 domain-containing protein [Anaerosacchariphilus polymeriproducens]